MIERNGLSVVRRFASAMPFFDEVSITEAEQIKNREIVAIILIYVVFMIAIVCMYESVAPVINNPRYPFYNNYPNYNVSK
ncbi:unnamed protein product [Bursaphelenchus xylophilus]|uniref:(pine wood nematode) hypothetical protein n=1 Tax=Bursaphelenchus xylophilus TaxID=6326 RepID=A0A1I7S1M9_BURXY|nr:unnamed protein product [Bursaphelenchus xylophilus]CAG9081239.1 unnamed protein product [Bursaphelenchus xylophilus]